MPWSVSDLPPSVRHQEWSDHQKEVFVKAANAALEEYKDDGKAIAVGTAAAEHAGEKKNASQFPQIFYARHMLPGIAGYESERILIDADSMKRAAPSFVGKPVYVQHQKVDLQNLHEADGFVVDCFYNEVDGWLWAKCLAISDAAHRAIGAKWSVSNAYMPIDWEGEGQHLAVDYDRKIRNYEFTHLAIVPNPRYEEAKIFTPEEFKAYQAEKRSELEELQNSKPSKGESVMKFFRTKNEEIKAGDTILDTDFVEITNDDGSKQTVTVAELKKAKRAEKELQNKKNEKMCDDGEEIEIDGEKVNMGALKECYKNMKKNEKKNEEDEKKKKEDDEKKNKEDEEKKKEDEKKNADEAKRVQEIANAGRKSTTSTASKIETLQDKVKRGADRYGK